MSNLFKAPKVNFAPTGFNAGGLNVSGFGNVTASPARTGLVGGLSDASSTEADILGGLRGTVVPGYNNLLESRLNQINDSARSAIGDLSQNLATRRILGSSFGEDTLSRARAEFSRQRDAAIADNFLKSLDVNTQLTQREFAARRSAFQAGLDELNLEAGIASKVSGTANQLMAETAKLQASLDASANANNLKLISSVGGMFLGPTIGGAGNALAKGLGFA